jgi:hypothetical protein
VAAVGAEFRVLIFLKNNVGVFCACTSLLTSRAVLALWDWGGRVCLFVCVCVCVWEKFKNLCFFFFFFFFFCFFYIENMLRHVVPRAALRRALSSSSPLDMDIAVGRLAEDTRSSPQRPVFGPGGERAGVCVLFFFFFFCDEVVLLFGMALCVRKPRVCRLRLVAIDADANHSTPLSVFVFVFVFVVVVVVVSGLTYSSYYF